MASNSKQSLAEAISAIKHEIVSKDTALRTLTDTLVDEVGEGGETFTTAFGTVQVTQQTEDRLTDQFVVVFDKEKYLGLDNKTKAKFEALGLVKMERARISGQSPKVVVRLR